ncbi:MAG: hypothetical protein EBR27_12885 [Betaproteobacteria bacterium]|nr:hypothetical protein [Betaproteobacteria bacterium]
MFTIQPIVEWLGTLICPMNTQPHRLVFNPSRGCLMAVAETSRSCGKACASGTTQSTCRQRRL